MEVFESLLVALEVDVDDVVVVVVWREMAMRMRWAGGVGAPV